LSYIISQNNLYITNFKKGHWEFLEQCKHLIEFVKENGYSLNSIIEIEPKSSGKDVVNTLKKQTSLNIKEAKNPTKDKEARANDISPFIESGRVYLVRGGWNDDFIQQCATFPNAKHDEEVDCLIMACHRAFKRKGTIRVG
jgi:predicted phage terminase large subunit-like protein